MMRPFALQVGSGDFALAPSHRRIAISLLAGTLNSAAAFAIAVASVGRRPAAHRLATSNRSPPNRLQNASASSG
jgi:hypothetical protein